MASNVSGYTQSGLMIDQNRVVFLDAIRGFALLGVLLTNLMQSYGFVRTDVDHGVAAFLRVFAEGTFYPIFAFLFGLGISLQLLHKSSADYLKRRLVILALIGFLHGVLIYPGDILFMYGVMGLVILSLSKRADKTLLVMSIALWMFSFGLFLTEPSLLTPHSKPNFNPGADAGYFRMVAERLREFGLEIVDLFVIGPAVLGMMLLGYVAGRRGGSTKLTRLPLKRIGLTCGLVAAPLSLWSLNIVSFPYELQRLHTVEYFLASPLIGGVYIVTLSYFSGQYGKLETLFASLGQMSLTNYLAQSLICTTLFYPYGLGLYGSEGLAAVSLFGVALYLGQAVFSAVWLKEFRHGPAELVWRKITSR